MFSTMISPAAPTTAAPTISDVRFRTLKTKNFGGHFTSKFNGNPSDAPKFFKELERAIATEGLTALSNNSASVIAHANTGVQQLMERQYVMQHYNGSTAHTHAVPSSHDMHMPLHVSSPALSEATAQANHDRALRDFDAARAALALHNAQMQQQQPQQQCPTVTGKWKPARDRISTE